MPSPDRSSPARPRAAAAGYLWAVLAIAVALLLRQLVDPIVGDRFPFLTIYAAVLLVAAYFGFIPALFTVVIGFGAATYLFVAPRFHLTVPADGVLRALLVRAALAGVVAAIGASWYRAHQRGLEQRRQIRGALRERERRYRTLFDYAPDGILIADRESYYHDANPAICRMLGYTRDELVGLHASDIVAAQETDHIVPALQTITEGGRYQREWRFRRKDGSTFQADVIATEMPDGMLLGMVRDVTEQRTLEAQYQQAQKMDAIGRLAGGVAHDFNNLLTVILGNCELLHDNMTRSSQAWHDVHDIQLAGERAAALTRQLLAFSRKQVVAPTRLDLNTVVADMRSMIERLIGEHIKVTTALATDLAPISADRSQLEQVLLNLSVNARDAMPVGGTLTLETTNVMVDEHHPRTHLTATPGPYVALTVSDTGVGMSSDVLAHLFEPFFTTKEIGSGTGLGLATIHGIVKQNGGFIHVYSEVGHGTSFRVYLPQDAAATAPAGPVPNVDDALAGTETVLIVEDSVALRALAKRLLERLGYNVLTAADAESAMALVEHNTAIDVLLTDVVMPGASGPELTNQLIARRPWVKVIFMSGYTEDAILSHGVVKPGVEFLHKPFTTETLGRKLREVLGRP